MGANNFIIIIKGSLNQFLTYQEEEPGLIAALTLLTVQDNTASVPVSLITAGELKSDENLNY